MAEILFSTKDNTHGNALVDRVGSYKRGYAISIHPDGWVWSDDERSASYRIVKIPGVTVERVLQSGILNPELDPGSTGGNPIIYRRRRYKLDLDNWTQEDDDAIVMASTDTLKLSVISAKTIDLQGT